VDAVAGSGAATVGLAGQLGNVNIQRVSGGGDERLSGGLVSTLDLATRLLLTCIRAASCSWLRSRSFRARATRWPIVQSSPTDPRLLWRASQLPEYAGGLGERLTQLWAAFPRKRLVRVFTRRFLKSAYATGVARCLRSPRHYTSCVTTRPAAPMFTLLARSACSSEPAQWTVKPVGVSIPN
jgi:hypothetical protein